MTAAPPRGTVVDGGYLVRPSDGSGDGPWPGLVVIHEVLGLTDDLKRAADFLADQGYLVVAPQYLENTGIRCVRAAFRDLKRQHGRAFEIIDAARRMLVTHSDSTGRVGVIGFCMGGGFALLAAGRGEYQVASVNYGMLPEDLDDAVAGSCPMIASYGAKDVALRGAAERLEISLTRQHVEHEVDEYPGVGHAFLLEYEPTVTMRFMDRFTSSGYDRETAERAWPRILEYLGARLKT